MKPLKRKGKSSGEPLYHKCSVLGCGCVKSYLYYRSDSQSGGVYLCDTCADEIADLLDDVAAAEIDVETVIAGFEDMYPEYRVVKADSVADPEPMTVEKLKELYPDLNIGEVGTIGDAGVTEDTSAIPEAVSLSAEEITLTGGVDFGDTTNADLDGGNPAAETLPAAGTIPAPAVKAPAKSKTKKE